jgi:hypothetical protein
MAYVEINTGVVVGVFATPQPDRSTVDAPEGVGLGWCFDGKAWTKPSGASPLSLLTARQLRLGLLKIGIKPADVAAAIAGLPADQRDAAAIEWDYASEYRRDHPLIATLGEYFGLSTNQIDAAWLDAIKL